MGEGLEPAETLTRLETAGKSRSGHGRGRFRHWSDTDQGGCDTRREVLLTEAVQAPEQGEGCALAGWAIADHMHTDLVIDALAAAELTRGSLAGAVPHTDHGSQYTSRAFADTCRRAGTRQSMSAIGPSADNRSDDGSTSASGQSGERLPQRGASLSRFRKGRSRCGTARLPYPDEVTRLAERGTGLCGRQSRWGDTAKARLRFPAVASGTSVTCAWLRTIPMSCANPSGFRSACDRVPSI